MNYVVRGFLELLTIFLIGLILVFLMVWWFNGL